MKRFLVSVFVCFFGLVFLVVPIWADECTKTETNNDCNGPGQAGLAAKCTVINSPVDWCNCECTTLISASDTGGTSATSSSRTVADPCLRLPQGSARNVCQACMNNDPVNPAGFWTAIGCLSTLPNKSSQQLTIFFMGLAGLATVIQIIIAGYEILVSRGDVSKLQSARDRITGSIIALLFVIFCTTILEFVGVQILNLPGFFDK